MGERLSESSQGDQILHRRNYGSCGSDHLVSTLDLLWTLRIPTLALENELESPSIGMLELDKVQVMLSKARNAQCSPISRLLSELLASIF